MLGSSRCAAQSAFLCQRDAARSRPFSLAVMCHCQRRGAQVILGRDSHLHLYEHGGVAQVGAADGAEPVASAARVGQAGGRLAAALRWLPASRSAEEPSLGCAATSPASPGPRVGLGWDPRAPSPVSSALPCTGRRSLVCTPRHCRTCPMAPSTWSCWS